jgi:LacI family transcriptional regulator
MTIIPVEGSQVAQTETLTEKFATRLRKEIQAGRWVDRPLPSERELSGKYQVSRVTIRRSLKQLCGENLVEARPGKGYFVVPGATATAATDGGRVVLFLHCHENGEHRLDALHAGIMNGAMAEAHRQSLELYATSQSAASFRRTLAERWRHDLRGVLLDWYEPKLGEFMLEARIPFVVVETDLGELPVTTVIQDNVGGVRLGLDWLAGRGHRRIAMLASEEDAVHPRQRLAGYREWLLHSGIEFNPAWVARGANDAAGGRECAAAVLDAPERPTAIFVGHREMLAGVFEELARRGLSQPADLELVVWGPPGPDEPAGGLIEVSYVAWSREEMGRLAMMALGERVKAGRSERVVVRVPATLVARGPAGVAPAKPQEGAGQ